MLIRHSISIAWVLLLLLACMPGELYASASSDQLDTANVIARTNEGELELEHRGSKRPTKEPTLKPTKAPVEPRTRKPTQEPTLKPTKAPVEARTKKPTKEPTSKPTKANALTKNPSNRPTKKDERHLCTELCATAGNGKCEDGGPFSVASTCAYGSDCMDCGMRDPVIVIPSDLTKTPTDTPTQQPQPEEEGICTNQCFFKSDGECDDGGPGSLSMVCAYGSDCDDCGARPPMTGAPVQEVLPTLRPTSTISPTSEPVESPTSEPVESPTSEPVESPTSEPVESPTNKPTARPTAEPTLMPTTEPTLKPTTRPTAKPTLKPTTRPTAEPTKRPVAEPTTKGDNWLCTNTCFFPKDGECDDGGPGSTSSACPFGTDCADCGVRDGGPQEPPTSPPTYPRATNAPSSQPPSRSPTAGMTTGAPVKALTSRPTQRPYKKPTPVPTRKGATLSPVNPQDVWNCNNLCMFASDGECDDGGPGSTSFICMYGSDCDDCGVRTPATMRPRA